MLGRYARSIVVVAILGLSGGCVDLEILGQPELPRCSGAELTDCLAAQSDLTADNPDCTGEHSRVCLVPLGQVSPEVVDHIVAYFRDEYELEIHIASALAIPRDLVNLSRRQIEGWELAQYMQDQIGQPVIDSGAVVIGLTSLDLYTENQDWRFEFGERSYDAETMAVISTYRMNLGESSRLASNHVVLERTHKMFERYVGFLHYGLFQEDDDLSPLRRSILSLRDLDEISEQLPTAVQD